MRTDSIRKNRNGVNFQREFTTGSKERVERILVQSVPVLTYFQDQDVSRFCDRYGNVTNVRFNIDINLRNSNMIIRETECVYRSDGAALSSRQAHCDDIIDVYAHVVIPVAYTYTTEIGDYFHLDINPTPGHKYTTARNGIHSWVPIDTNKEEFEVSENPSNELLVKQMNVYLRPSAIRRATSIDEQGAPPMEGTVRDRTIFHTDEEFWFDPKDKLYDPTMFRLGKIIVHANSNMKDNMTILDTRTRGGGIDEAISRDVISQMNKETLYHWDIGYFDGEAYQENGVIIVKVPRSILKSKDNPNGFHELEIQEAVAKHKTFGVLPIIEYYDPQLEDEDRLNVLYNPEFWDGKHVSFYNEELSTGDYSIEYMESIGSGDNYVLQINNDAEYAITIPSHVLTENAYEIDIKALKTTNANSRSVGRVLVNYEDETQDVWELPPLNHNVWMIYKQKIEWMKDVKNVTIVINRTAGKRDGTIYIDYIKMKPTYNINEENSEVYEI